MSKKIIVNAEGVPTATDAKLVDVLTTVLSSDTALTGTYGLAQKALLVAAGMSIESKMRADTFKPSLLGG